MAGVLLDGLWSQRQAARRLRELSVAEVGETVSRPAPAPGSPVARLRAEDLGLDVIALEGVDSSVLRRGAGHFPGTALPGSSGNASFAGHRDTFFRGLRGARPGQRIEVETPAGSFLYEVQRTRIVAPDAVEVVAPVAEGPVLTLVTCYPFDWIGPAPQRFVVRASLVEEPGSRPAKAPSGSAVTAERTP